MHVANGHKGKRSLRACCHGREGHSALAPEALNALHLGAAFIIRLQERQEQLRLTGNRDEAYDVPYSTIHVGIMRGGTALNIVPARCELDLEIRFLANDDPEALIAGINDDAEAVAAPHRNRFPEALIEVEALSGYPGLDTPAETPAVALLQSLLGHSQPPIKVAFGTEGGLFQDALEIPTLVCGPWRRDTGQTSSSARAS